MKSKGPLVTLLGGGALAAVLLTASIIAATGNGDDPDPVAGDGATPTPEASPDPDQVESPEPEEEPEPVTYVGWADGGGASVAIIVTGDEAIAYVCDGAAVEAWLSGSARDGELLLSGNDGTLTGSYDDALATGQTTASGRDFTFSVELVAPPEGLYRFADTVVGGADVVAGWIVLPDGTQIGAVNMDGVVSPAPALDLDTGEVEIAGTTVSPDRLG